MLLQLQGEKLPGSRPASHCLLLWRRKGFSLSQSNSCSIDTGLTVQIRSHQLIPALTSVGTERLNTAVRMRQMFCAADFFTPEISPNYKLLWCWAILTSFKSTWLRMWQDLVNSDQVAHHINENIYGHKQRLKPLRLETNMWTFWKVLPLKILLSLISTILLLNWILWVSHRVRASSNNTLYSI